MIVYRSPDGQSLVQLRAVAGTVWLTQAQIAELYDTSVSNIAHIIRRILDDGEVSQATIDSESRVQAEGARTVRREVKIYNLDMVLAVGYRVTTPRAVQFRQWATTVLREYLVKGFALDDPRLKDSTGTDYFDELLHRIRDIRAAEWEAQTDRFLAFNERSLLAGSGMVSASRMKAVTADRYAEFEERRQAVEAERAEADEMDDLRNLTAIENRRADPERDEDAHLP